MKPRELTVAEVKAEAAATYRALDGAGRARFWANARAIVEAAEEVDRGEIAAEWGRELRKLAGREDEDEDEGPPARCRNGCARGWSVSGDGARCLGCGERFTPAG